MLGISMQLAVDQTTVAWSNFPMRYLPGTRTPHIHLCRAVAVKHATKAHVSEEGLNFSKPAGFRVPATGRICTVMAGQGCAGGCQSPQAGVDDKVGKPSNRIVFYVQVSHYDKWLANRRSGKSRLISSSIKGCSSEGKVRVRAKGRKSSR